EAAHQPDAVLRTEHSRGSEARRRNRRLRRPDSGQAVRRAARVAGGAVARLRAVRSRAALAAAGAAAVGVGLAGILRAALAQRDAADFRSAGAADERAGAGAGQGGAAAVGHVFARVREIGAGLGHAARVGDLFAGVGDSGVERARVERAFADGHV